ncbi:outer membrane protein assembly factor BamB family protein [Streptomyces sp. NBC_01429]|uniref:outer membrane protein assembly factor BamB family protein n=1 Tax=Streptomyces sp. NBC_01429 TaxID=2903862 RepID=UPI002E2DA434|nr:PQQ-binding-like beta-propeller repeat protein [Streptomyces sp. NBC_01429]
MTQPPQPPQPPNEPPQGGFGPPQEPPAGGFGAPQDPPPGGYGYPTQPPQPPQQPGYGYPTQPPAQPPTQPPYQQQYQPPYQQQPYQQQQYQQFQQPQPATAFGVPGAGDGGGKKSKTQLQIIIAAAVAVVLIIGTGVYFLTSSGDGDKNEAKDGSSSSSDGGKDGDKGVSGGGGKEQAPVNTKAKVAFQVPLPKVTDLTSVYGSWLSDTTYVKTGINQIVGYDLVKGTQLWTIPLPGEPCAKTDHVSKDYKTAIAFAAGKPTADNKYPRCTKVGVIDLKAGELLWSKSVKGTNAGDRDVGFSEITLSGETVAGGGFDGGAAFDLNTGAIRWKPDVSSDGCYDSGYGGGDGLVAVRRCGSSSDPQLSVQALNPLTGAPISSYKMPAGVDYPHIVSSKPLVVAADVGDTAGDGSGISDFFSIDEKTGKLRARISAAGKFEARCGSTDVEKCSLIVVGNDKIYLPTAEHEGEAEYGRTNEIVSYDLATGKSTTDRADAGERYKMYPLRMDGSNLLAYKTPPYDKGGQIVSLDGSSFKETLLMENPGDKAIRDAESGFGTISGVEIRYQDGRMFIASPFLSKPSEYDSRRYLAMSFTTKK